MVSVVLGYGFCLFCALVVILGDTLIKHAADGDHPLSSSTFLAGAGLYLLSALLWYFAMRHITLAQAGVAFSMFTLLALCLIGATVFGEQILPREALGIALAVVSMMLMTRII